MVWALAAWRRPKAEQPALLAVAEASQQDQARQQEVRVMGQTIAEALIEQGIERGIERGIEQGMARGALANARTSLRKVLEKRFGPLPESVTQRIDASNDLERLQGALVEAAVASRLDEVPL
jgi:hypothetical protein